MRQQLCTLTADEAGQVVDRLTALEHLIPPAAIEQALWETGTVDSRACKLTHAVMLWVVLARGIVTDVPIRQVCKRARRLREGEDAPHRSSLCIARQRLGIAPVRHWFHQTVRLLATPQTPGAFSKGWRLMAFAGSIDKVADSDAHAQAFGRSDGHRGPSARPQIRKLSLVEVGTPVEVDLVLRGIKGSGRGEPSRVSALFHHLRPDRLVLWDRGFFSYFLWQQLRQRGVQVLARVSSGLILQRLWSLPDGSYLAQIYPRVAARNRAEEGIVVRVIRYTVDDPQRVGHGQEPVLLTTLLDADTYAAEELIEKGKGERRSGRSAWGVTK